MTDAWPAADAPFTPLRDSYREQPERNVVSFAPEVGAPIERRRTSLSLHLVDFVIPVLIAKWPTLLAFYADTLKDGVLPFTATDPILGGTKTYRFRDAPKIIAVRLLKVHVAISIRRMP